LFWSRTKTLVVNKRIYFLIFIRRICGDIFLDFYCALVFDNTTKKTIKKIAPSFSP